MFFINLAPAPTDKQVFAINRLCHAAVTIEEPKKIRWSGTMFHTCLFLSL